MKNDLDRDLSLSLEESSPQASRLDAAHLHAHDTRIHRQDRAFSTRENQAHALSLGGYRALSVLVAVGVILVLLWGVMDLPAFGRDTNPVENEVAERYLAQGLQEGGATNLVANMILDYRAFDTLGRAMCSLPRPPPCSCCCEGCKPGRRTVPWRPRPRRPPRIPSCGPAPGPYAR